MGRRGKAASLAGKRIVFVFAGEILGGAERGALDLAIPLARVEGADVQVLALDDRPGRARTIAEAEGIPWRTVRTPWVGSRAARAASLLRVAAALRRLRPDVLVAHTNLPNVACGLIWRLTGARLFVWTQWDVLGTKRFSPALFRRALQATPLVITEAFHARDWLIEEWGADPGRVHVIRGDVQLSPARESRAVWRERLGLGDGDFAACMLAHFHSGKDHTTLLHAWRRAVDELRGDGPNPVLLLAGRSAGTENAVKALAFDLELREHVRFLGEVEDVTGLLGAIELAVFSSRSELFGRGASEPMRAGLPVVGTDVPGISEPVGKAGKVFLAPPGDSAAMAQAIVRLARDRALRARVGQANAELMRSRQPAEATSRAYARLVADALACRAQDPTPRTDRERHGSRLRAARRRDVTTRDDMAAAPASGTILARLFESIGIDRDYSALDLDGLTVDLHGWGSGHPIFDQVFREICPAIVIEVGSWKGASVLHMHALSREYGLDSRFICVDTWLGSNDSLWLDPECRQQLLLRGGYPTMFRQFVFNVLEHNAADDVFPLPMTSTAAARVLRKLNVVADAIYLDAGHEEEEVAADLSLYFELLRPGGVIFGDDYHTRWPGIIGAVDTFCSARRLKLTVRETKWLVRKPEAGQRSRWKRRRRDDYRSAA